MRLGIVGQTTRDLVDGGRPRPGGAPLYAARALVLLGHPAAIATTTAEDDRPLVEPLAELGLPTTWHASPATATYRLEHDGDERSVEIVSPGTPFSAADADGWIADALGDAEVVHCGALSRLDFPAGTLAALRAQGRRVSLDGQGLARPGRPGPVALDAAHEPGILRCVDVLKLAAAEADALGVARDPAGLASLGVPEVVLTLGSAGALVLADGQAERIEVEPLDVADTTGAGDAFAAAYLALRQADAEPVEAGRAAAAVVARLLA